MTKVKRSMRIKRSDRFGLAVGGFIRCCFLAFVLVSAVTLLPARPAQAAGPEVLQVTDELVKAAKAEGSVTLRHNSPVDFADGMARTFTKQYGIKVDIDRRQGALGGQQFLMEERAGKHIVDVFWSTDAAGRTALRKEGFILNYTYPDVKNKFVDGTYDEGWAYGGHMVAIVISYNPQLIPHAEAKRLFKTWKGLLDPSLKGKIGMSDPAGGGTPIATYTMFYQRPEYGRDFFVKLAAQNPRVYPGSAPGREELAAGAIAVFIPNWEGIAMTEFMKGDRTAWTYPEMAPVVCTARAVISKNAPHPNAARLFAQYPMTPEGIQTVMAFDQTSTIKGVKDTRRAIPKLKQTDWWKPYPMEIAWMPDDEYIEKNYNSLVKDMREILGWKK